MCKISTAKFCGLLRIYELYIFASGLKSLQYKNDIIRRMTLLLIQNDNWYLSIKVWELFFFSFYCFFLIRSTVTFWVKIRQLIIINWILQYQSVQTIVILLDSSNIEKIGSVKSISCASMPLWLSDQSNSFMYWSVW